MTIHSQPGYHLSGTLFQLTTDYGIVFVLLALAAFFSVATYKEQDPTGAAAGRQLANAIVQKHGVAVDVVILAGTTDEANEFTAALVEQLAARGARIAKSASGDPPQLRSALESFIVANGPVDVIACSKAHAHLSFLQDRAKVSSKLAAADVMVPSSYHWPDFLKAVNLRAVGNRIAVIAIIAIGMTMVIITAGIDLSVGSQIALSAVVAAWLIRSAGQESVVIAIPISWCVAWHASVGLVLTVSAVVELVRRRWWRAVVLLLVGLFLPYVAWRGAWVWVGLIHMFGQSVVGMTLSCLTAVALCTGIGTFSGGMVTVFRVPPFIVTLAMMLVASGLAFIIAENQSIYQLPESFTWLGRGIFWGVPHAVILMLALYVVAHVVMTRTVFGRYIYAVGGNPHAARLSGVPVRRVVLACYVICGGLAGVGGIIRASELKSGEPTYGLMAELEVIAAVVVGGTSLAGGQGKILGTLIGALIIAVIGNGMNLTNIESNTQKVVLGLVILGAVLLDQFKKHGWRFLRQAAEV